MLKDAGFSFEIIRSEWRASSLEIYQKINTLASTYPQICKKFVYGVTATDGSELCALKISDNVSIDENEAEILFDGGIHGNEYAGPDLLIRFAQYICSNYGSNTTITNLINQREIWFFVMVNPEGRDRGTRGSATCSDLNRTYGYMISNGFLYQEPRRMRDCMLQNQFVIHLTYHTGIEYLLFPWGYTGSVTADKTIHKSIADLYSTTSGYYNPSLNVQSYNDYPTTGETIDYAYGALGELCLTMEISNGSTLTDSYYNYNQPAMLKMIEYAGYGIEGVITDSINGAPLAAVIYISSYYPMYSDPLVGDYHKYVPAGIYTVKVTANGYLSKTITDVSVLEKTSAKVNVQLDRNTTHKHYVYKVVSAESGTGKTQDILGIPDGKTYSGKVVIDMQSAIEDNPGNEIKVYTYGSITCSAGETPDGPWVLLGSGTEFDLSVGAVSSARYFKLSGAAVDAVETTIDATIRENVIGSFAAMGVWQRNSDSLLWSKLSKDEALQIAVGDFDGDGKDDLLGWWNCLKGIFLRKSSDGSWQKIMADDQLVGIACGDVNDDGLCDLIGAWDFGLFVNDTASGIWTKLSAQRPDMLASADFNSDSKDDILAVFAKDIWIRYSGTGIWTKQSINRPDLLVLTTAQMNADETVDILGSWSYGLWWQNGASKIWTKLSNNPSSTIAAGDIDGDEICDVIAGWAKDGLWVRYSSTGLWERISKNSVLNLAAGRIE
jgi:hypothetical protein